MDEAEAHRESKGTQTNQSGCRRTHAVHPIHAGEQGYVDDGRVAKIREYGIQMTTQQDRNHTGNDYYNDDDHVQEKQHSSKVSSRSANCCISRVTFFSLFSYVDFGTVGSVVLHCTVFVTSLSVLSCHTFPFDFESPSAWSSSTLSLSYPFLSFLLSVSISPSRMCFSPPNRSLDRSSPHYHTGSPKIRFSLHDYKIDLGMAV